MIREVKRQVEWDELVNRNSGHPLQLWAWGELKSAHGPWSAARLAVEKSGKFIGGAQVLARRLPTPFKQLFYVPRGPFGAENNGGEVLSELAAWARERGGVELKIEPDWTEFRDWPRGWRKSKNRILLARTAQIDLGKTEDEILADMSKKTRQYIRKSENSGVKIRRVTSEADIAKCLEIYRQTAEQRKFGLHGDDYYHNLAKFAGNDNQIYLAEKDGASLSFLWNLRTPICEFELYGGVNEIGEKLRSNYILKWRAISEAKKFHVKSYDLNGLLNDGISNFKRGFTAVETNLSGAWDLPLSPLYFTWETLLPAAKKIVQKIAKTKR